MRRSLILLTLLGLVAGCSSGSFVGQRFDNFTAYYNKFFNAKRIYARATKPTGQQDQPIDRTLFLPIFEEVQTSSGAKEFQDVITKSADVLREHPNSKWVDDALLLIGKAYFHQQNHFGAEQKFQEVISLAGPLDGEARFWLARTLIASGSYDQAHQHLTSSLENEDLSPRWEPMLRLALGELHVRQGEWSEAVKELTTGLENVRGRALKARTQFLLGQVHEALGQYEEAVAAFSQVERYSPLYELSYAAKLSAVRVAGLHGDAEWALQNLRRMERDGKNYSNRAELAFMRGRILHAMGHADEALRTYDNVLYASDVNISAIRGRIHYALGELFRDEYEDFIFAAAHFDTAATALKSNAPSAAGQGRRSGSDAALQFSREAITDAQELAEQFRTFAQVRSDIALMDSLLHLGSLDDEAFQAVVLDLRKQRAAELEAQRREMERRQAEQDFRNAGNVPGLRGNNTPVQTTTAASSTAGFLFHQEPNRVQEARQIFIDRWGERPLVPNWRRMEAITSLAEHSDENGEAGGVRVTNPRTASTAEMELPQVDVSGVPRTSDAQAKMRADRANARYELANVLFLSMNMPDSAAAWYRMVIEQDGDQPVASRAFYALAEVHRSLGDVESARRLYRQILDDYPESDFVDRVREQLGLPSVERAPTDSVALAEEAYRQAYALWKRGRYSQGIRAMLDISAEYRTTEVAPRALLAAASAFTEWARRDSLDLFARIPLDVPDSLLWASGLARNEMKAQVLAAAADSAIAPVDSTAASAPADTTLVVAAPVVQPAALRLETLYSAISNNYPKSPYAQQAQSLLKALAERQPAPSPDDSTSTAEELLDTEGASTGLQRPVAPNDSVEVAHVRGSDPADALDALPATGDGPNAGPPPPAATDTTAVKPPLRVDLEPGLKREPRAAGTPEPTEADTVRTPREPQPAKKKVDL